MKLKYREHSQPVFPVKSRFQNRNMHSLGRLILIISRLSLRIVYQVVLYYGPVLLKLIVFQRKIHNSLLLAEFSPVNLTPKGNSRTEENSWTRLCQGHLFSVYFLVTSKWEPSLVSSLKCLLFYWLFCVRIWFCLRS